MLEVRFSITKRRIALIQRPVSDAQHPDQPSSISFTFPDYLAPKVVQRISKKQGVYYGQIQQKLTQQDAIALIDDIIRAYDKIHQQYALLKSAKRSFTEIAASPTRSPHLDWVLEPSTSSIPEPAVPESMVPESVVPESVVQELNPAETYAQALL